MLDAKPASWERLSPVESWTGSVKQPFQSSVPGNPIETAWLKLADKPVRNVDVVVAKPNGSPRDTEEMLIAQGPSGLGRVMLVAFDLDDVPFTAWTGKDAFWTRLQG